VLILPNRHPVLFAVDDFQAIYCKTAYRDPHFNPIRPYHLALPRLILDYASGKRSFVRHTTSGYIYVARLSEIPFLFFSQAKGAFLGAITSSDPNYKIPIELHDALDLPPEQFKSPYDRRSRVLVEYAEGLKSLRVPEKLSIKEAASLFEIWMKDKALVPSTSAFHL
jgi:small subunit ribosomal protein S29